MVLPWVKLGINSIYHYSNYNAFHPAHGLGDILAHSAIQKTLRCCWVSFWISFLMCFRHYVISYWVHSTFSTTENYLNSFTSLPFFFPFRTFTFCLQIWHDQPGPATSFSFLSFLFFIATNPVSIFLPEWLLDWCFMHWPRSLHIMFNLCP